MRASGEEEEEVIPLEKAIVCDHLARQQHSLQKTNELVEGPKRRALAHGFQVFFVISKAPPLA